MEAVALAWTDTKWMVLRARLVRLELTAVEKCRVVFLAPLALTPLWKQLRSVSYAQPVMKFLEPRNAQFAALGSTVSVAVTVARTAPLVPSLTRMDKDHVLHVKQEHML